MTATRSFPNEVTDPGGIGGQAYADRVKIEGDALWNGVITPCGSVGGSANSISAVCAPPLVADPADGQTFRLTPGANNTGAVQVNLDARGLIDLKDCDGNALQADDLIAGRAVEFQRFGSSGPYRLTQPTQRGLIAAMSSAIATASTWELIADTTVSSSVTQIEHTITAGRYAQILVIGLGISFLSNRSLTVTLRNSGGAIVSLVAGTSQSNTEDVNCEARFTINIFNNASNAKHSGRLWVFDEDVFASAGHASAPDRIRVAPDTADFIDAGRVITMGLKLP